MIYELRVPGHTIATFHSFEEALAYWEINYPNTAPIASNKMWISEIHPTSPVAPLGDSDDWFGSNEDL